LVDLEEGEELIGCVLAVVAARGDLADDAGLGKGLEAMSTIGSDSSAPEPAPH
jgi:hypothetical protein